MLLALELQGRQVVVVGGGPVTARRATAFAAAGARVRVVAPRLCPELSGEVDAGRLDWLPQTYAGPQDLQDAWLVHTATGHPDTDERVARDAAALRVWCVDASTAERGSAQVPARTEVVTPDGPIRLAVHAGGDPGRAAKVRDSLARQLREGRVDLRRRRPRGTGWVALVGAGPGTDGLLTTRARQVLACADVVVTDRLVPPGAAADLPPGVRVVDVGKSPGHHPLPQERINALLVELAASGQGVARLKGGDPYVFGRGEEERLACERHGIPVEVVPGVSSALAVPAAAGIPLTHRGLARGFTVVSGHEPPARLPADHTLVVLMGVAGFRRTASALLAAGVPADRPVAFVERGFAADQRVTTARLVDAADVAEKAGVRAPAVIVVGDVVTLSAHWPPSLPESTRAATRTGRTRMHTQVHVRRENERSQ